MVQLALDSRSLTRHEAETLWEDILDDEGLEWGSSACNVCITFSDDQNRRTLYIARHPSSGWYLEYGGTGVASKVFYSADSNAADWSHCFMTPDLVHDVDSEGNVWALLTLDGEESRILQRCFVDDAVASKVVHAFVKTGDVSSGFGMVDIATVKPYPMWEQWNYDAELNR